MFGASTVTEYAPTIRGLKPKGFYPDLFYFVSVTEYAPTIRGLKLGALATDLKDLNPVRDGIRPDNQGIETGFFLPCAMPYIRHGDGIRPDNQGIETRSARQSAR